MPTPEKLQSFLRSVEGVLSEEQLEFVRVLVRTVEALWCLLEKGRYSMARLRRLLFGPKTEKTAGVARKAGASPTGSNPEPNEKSSGACGTKKKGHGRRSLKKDFPGAERVSVLHPTLKPGDFCSRCARGKMYRLNRSGAVARFFGRPFLFLVIWEPEGWRCNACQETLFAPLPEEAKGPKYDVTAKSMVALMRYGTGMPFYRMAQHQESLGVPLAPSVQWEMVRELADQAAPAHQALIQEAARGTVLYNDDTRGRVLELSKAIVAEKQEAAQTKTGKPLRTGIATTGIVSHSADHAIALYVTGRQHAGENLRDLLTHRPAEMGPPIQMCDALSHNVPLGFATLLANCLAHARRHIVDMTAFFPEECLHVLLALKTIWGVDLEAKERKLSAEERLKLHQEKSRPVLEELKVWMQAQFDQRKVEPNSGLGKAFQYFFNHWEPLTLFLQVPGAPIDSNLVERALKWSIRHRKNSLFYKTQRGAAVGDRLMSLLKTCQLNGVNGFDYLTALQENASAVQAEPKNWLPWNYKTAVAVAPGPPAGRQTASSSEPAPSVPEALCPANLGHPPLGAPCVPEPASMTGA